jgi:hypothetical protein
MSRPHPSRLSNRLPIRYARIPTNHGPVTTCDSVPCALPCDGCVVTRTHALPSQSEFSDNFQRMGTSLLNLSLLFFLTQVTSSFISGHPHRSKMQCDEVPSAASQSRSESITRSLGAHDCDFQHEFVHSKVGLCVAALAFKYCETLMRNGGLFGLSPLACFSFWGLRVITCYSALSSFSVLVIIVLDGTARSPSMSPTPFCRSHYVSGNIPKFYY